MFAVTTALSASFAAVTASAASFAVVIEPSAISAVADVVSLFKYSAKFFALLAIIRNTSPLFANYLLV